MPLPTPNLDDLRFQKDLVDEARRRIIRYCPEWTDYNLSDPGITLIELFAWMTEMLVYRLNRVPEKTFIKFLDLLGVQLQPAASAQVGLTFRLSAPFPLGPQDDTVAIIPQGTEVATQASEEQPEIIFTTDERLVIAPPRLTQVRREEDWNRNYLSRLGVEDFYAFDRAQPQVGDAFYLGFDETHKLSGHLLQLVFKCRETEATGVRREDPPLVWECSAGDGRWEEVALSTRPGEKDTTGGLNNAAGSLVLYLPLTMQADQIHGRSAYWVRCRLEPRREGQGMYTQSPRIRGIAPFVLGGTVWATHAVIRRDEILGVSSGEPGQVFYLQRAPLLALQTGESLEIEEQREGQLVFVPWQRVADLADSERYDRHFTLDEATGEVALGPCVRQPAGAMRQYGRVPQAGRRIRMSQYRHGGGVVGNVPAGKLQVLRSAIPYIDRVANLQRASGGRDQESLEEAQLRARRELRAQGRAVTAEDFENLGRGASRAVARIKCCTPGAGDGSLPPLRAEPTRLSSSQAQGKAGAIELLVVPAAFDALKAGDLSQLAVDQALRKTIRAHLDQYRLLTATLNIREPHYVGVQVSAKIVPSEYHRPEAVAARVKEVLRCTLSPLKLQTEEPYLAEILGPEWEGWPFGRDLFLAEIYSLLQQVPGVKHVIDVQLGCRPVIPTQEAGGERREAGDSFRAEAPRPEPDLAPVEQKMLPVPGDALLCSLEHQVQWVEL